MRELVYLGSVDYISLLSHINDNNLADGDVIHVSCEDYKNLITDSALVSEPCYIKDVYVKKSDIDIGYIQVIKCTLSPLQSVDKDIYPRFPIIYRCGWCGNIVAEDGSLVDFTTRQNIIKTIQRFGNEVKIIAVSGACCPNEEPIVQTELEREAAEFERIVRRIFDQNKNIPNRITEEDVYGIDIRRFKDIQNKLLSEVDDDDLTFLGLERINDEDFRFIYSYKDFNNIKIYFNKDVDKFEMRGFRLKKEKDINSVKELIDNSLIHWKLKIDI